MPKCHTVFHLGLLYAAGCLKMLLLSSAGNLTISHISQTSVVAASIQHWSRTRGCDYYQAALRTRIQRDLAYFKGKFNR